MEMSPIVTSNTNTNTNSNISPLINSSSSSPSYIYYLCEELTRHIENISNLIKNNAVARY
jgi:hypothetical protein